MKDKTLTPEQSESLRRRAKEAMVQQSISDFEFCRILFETAELRVKDADGGYEKVWSSWGYRSWGDYVEAELGIVRGYGYTLKAVYRKFGIQLFGSWSKDNLVSISKLIVLQSVVTKQNVDSWLKKAQRMPIPELKKAVKKAKGLEEGMSLNGYYVFIANLTDTEADAVDKAIAIVRQKDPCRRQGKALGIIVRDWLAMMRK